MPGINTAGTPSTSNYLLGRGAAILHRLDATTGKMLEGRHLGHMVALTGSSDIQTLEHFSSRGGIRTVDRRVVQSQALNFQLTIDEVLDFDNLALWMQGEALGAQANPSSAGNITDRLITDTAILGRWYPITNAAGNRMFDINPATFSLKSHATTLGSASVRSQGSDYILEAAFGQVFIPTGGAIAAGDNLWFSYTSGGEQTLSRVKIQTKQSITGALEFRGINAADNKRFVMMLYSVSLLPEGDASFLGEDYAQLVLSCVAGRNELGYPDSPVGDFYYHTDA